jgi:hypothetical protein
MKNIKNLLYSIPIAVASFLPNKANAQFKEINNNDKYYSNYMEPIKIENPNAIYFGVQPIDLGLSVGYSRKITPKLGAYILLSKGKYISPFNLGDSENSHVNHFRIGFGGMIHTKKDNNGSSAFISLGSSYSFLDKKHYIPGTINEKAFRKLSLEGGAGGIIAEKFGFGFIFDWMKGESNIYCVIPFGHH